MKKEDLLGDRLKAQEQVEAGRRADAAKPMMCRLDGRAFHTFTKGLARPYDKRLSDLMIDTMRYLVDQTHADLGYAQSDEITLHWTNTAEVSKYMFDGKFQKLCSVLAGMASAYFSVELIKRIPEKSNTLAIFDARVWNVESDEDVTDNYKWRVADCVKNSISMAAQAHFSAKQLHGVGSEAKKVMLRAAAAPWENEPDFFRVGTFCKRVTREMYLSLEELDRIPTGHWPVGPIVRSSVEVVDGVAL